MSYEDDDDEEERYFSPVKINYLRKSGYVKRFHTLPTTGDNQTVSAHSWGVATILNEIWPDASKQVILATLYHDVAEILIGDIPTTAKWLYPEFAEAIEKAEVRAERYLDISFALSEHEKLQLKIADMLELMFFAKEQLHLGNQNFKEVLENGKNYLETKFGHTSQFKDAERMFGLALT